MKEKISNSSSSLKNILRPAPNVKDVPKLKLVEGNEESLRFIKVRSSSKTQKFITWPQNQASSTTDSSEENRWGAQDDTHSSSYKFNIGKSRQKIIDAALEQESIENIKDGLKKWNRALMFLVPGFVTVMIFTLMSCIGFASDVVLFAMQFMPLTLSVLISSYKLENMKDLSDLKRFKKLINMRQWGCSINLFVLIISYIQIHIENAYSNTMILAQILLIPYVIICLYISMIQCATFVNDQAILTKLKNYVDNRDN